MNVVKINIENQFKLHQDPFPRARVFVRLFPHPNPNKLGFFARNENGVPIQFLLSFYFEWSGNFKLLKGQFFLKPTDVTIGYRIQDYKIVTNTSIKFDRKNKFNAFLKTKLTL